MHGPECFNHGVKNNYDCGAVAGVPVKAIAEQDGWSQSTGVNLGQDGTTFSIQGESEGSPMHFGEVPTRTM
jgi:hypothetical protein